MNQYLKYILFIIIGTLIIYLGALVSFDIHLNETKIPITGQSLAVLVVGFLLGKYQGLLSVLLYLLLGIIGLPVFANGANGIEVFTKGSGGFLIGFLFAAYFIGQISETYKNKNIWVCINAMFLGTAVIIFFGICQLTNLYGFDKALEYGFFPFWQGAVIKILIGAAIVFIISKFTEIPYVK